MDFDINELREKIDCYLTNELSKEELGTWASQAYYSLLKGNFVELKKIVLYPFLKTISTIHIEANDKDDVFPCSKDDVKFIQQILHGTAIYNYNIETALPVSLYSMFKDNPVFDRERYRLFSKLTDALIIYTEQGHIVNDALSSCLKAVVSLEIKEETLQGLLECHIIKFLEATFNFSCGNTIHSKAQVKIYAQKSQSNIVINKLLKYLSCYTGKSGFHILICYQNGLAEMLFMV